MWAQVEEEEEDDDDEEGGGGGGSGVRMRRSECACVRMPPTRVSEGDEGEPVQRCGSRTDNNGRTDGHTELNGHNTRENSESMFVIH